MIADRSLSSRTAAELGQKVLSALPSKHSRRNYARALDEIVDFSAMRNAPVSPALVMEYRSAMVGKKLSASTVNVHLSAIRKLVKEALKDGILNAEQTASMIDVPNVRRQGPHLGKALANDRVRELLVAPDRSTILGKRDYCIFALSIGCRLGSRELSRLKFENIQLREGRWVVEGFVAKGGRIRTVAIPVWVKNAVNSWQSAAKIERGPLLRSLSKSGEVMGDKLGEWAIRSVVETLAKGRQL